MSFCSFQTTEKGLELAVLWINVAFFRKNCLVSSQYFALHRVLMAFLILNMSMKLFTAVDGWLLQVFEASSSQTTIARSDSICMEIFLAPYLISCIPVWFANKDISFLFPVGPNLIHPCSLLKWFIVLRHTFHGTVCLYRQGWFSVCVRLFKLYLHCKARTMERSNNNFKMSSPSKDKMRVAASFSPVWWFMGWVQPEVDGVLCFDMSATEICKMKHLSGNCWPV